MENKILIIELNAEGYEKLFNSSNPELFLQANNLSPFAKHLFLLENNGIFDYQKTDYLYQIQSGVNDATQKLTFANNLWNMNDYPDLMSLSLAEQKFYLNGQKEQEINFSTT